MVLLSYREASYSYNYSAFFKTQVPDGKWLHLQRIASGPLLEYHLNGGASIINLKGFVQENIITKNHLHSLLKYVAKTFENCNKLNEE